MLQYQLEIFQYFVVITISENSTKRLLYLDTLKAIGKEDDRAALSFLIKIHLRSANVSRSVNTATFNRIELSFDQALEVLKLLIPTRRLFYKGAALIGTFKSVAKLFWKLEGEFLYSCFVRVNYQDIAVENLSAITCNFCIFQKEVFALDTNISWKNIELFLKGPIVLTGAQKKRFVDEDPQVIVQAQISEPEPLIIPELVLSDMTGCFANLRFCYEKIGKIQFDDFSLHVEGKKRKPLEEKAFEKDLLEAGFIAKSVGNSKYYCSGDKVLATLKFLLELGWKVYSPQGCQIIKQTKHDIVLNNDGKHIAVSGDVHFGLHSIKLTLALAQKSLFCKIQDNVFGLLDKKSLPSFEGQVVDEKILIKKSQISSLIQLTDKPGVCIEESIKSLLAKVLDGAKIEDVILGPEFRGSLLPYQQKGVNWLRFLYEHGYCGLLADEMGLGKTVQVLAFFSTLRTNLPLLIVAPSSLLYQWKQEISKFLPERESVILSGKNFLKTLDGQIVITSYAFLRQEVEFFSSQFFGVIVLDESHHIKTATTQTAKSALALNGNFKICLNGTPIENRIEELFSQFKFLISDLKLLESNDIYKQIKPFILRRKKADVQIQLPEKLELFTYVDMNESQKSLYQEILAKARNGVLKKVQTDGISHHRMEVLETILRLRQVCLDPRLLGASERGSKIDLLLEDIGDRKVLIFSQFTSMLDLVAAHLEESQKRYFLLDGSVPNEKRAQMVSAFQGSDDVNIFLLSLKSGGVGLNLTAADYVFILDPWWNDAVESQAIDRAHRLGQRNTVIAKRYITINSIEEKMLQLKEKKKQLADSLLEGDEFQFSVEDLTSLLS